MVRVEINPLMQKGWTWNGGNRDTRSRRRDRAWRSGIGILRMSGEGCIERAAKVFTRADGKPLEAAEDRKLVLGTMADAEGRPVDHCMAFISRAPHSYTGEDTVEFQCHGSPAALTAGLEALFAAGFRQAGPGEFTRRAF